MYELNRTCSTCVRVVCVWLWASLALGRNAEAKSSGVCRLVADVSYSLSTSRRRDMQIYAASPRVNRLHRGVISFGGPTADQASVHSNINQAMLKEQSVQSFLIGTAVKVSQTN